MIDGGLANHQEKDKKKRSQKQRSLKENRSHRTRQILPQGIDSCFNLVRTLFISYGAWTRSQKWMISTGTEARENNLSSSTFKRRS